MPIKDREKRLAYQKGASRRNYEENKAAYIEKARKRKEETRVAWMAFKSTLSCFWCGFSHARALDFHHIIKKDHNKVHKLAADGSMKKAVEEIKKCIVLCANCHRILHGDKDFEDEVHKKIVQSGLFSEADLLASKTIRT